MSDVIISIPGATDVIVSGAAASSVVVTFPASNNFVTTIIDRGILYGVTGAQGPTGPQGSQGIQGIPGIGIAAGGSIGQILKKNSATDYDTSWLTLDKSAVNLSNVDNTTDLLKPISTATQTALNSKQNALGFSSIVASGTQVVLVASSNKSWVVTGSGGQVIKLPDATTLANGTLFYFNNNQSSGTITINNNSNTLIASIPSGGYTEITLLDNSIAAGSWERHEQAPSNVSWSTNTFDYPGSITSATWNGVAVADNRIASSTNWNTAYTNRITSLTTTGSSGAATLISNVLNIPNYSLSGLGGQPLATNLTSISALTFASTSFVKMTAAGTFALDTNTYLTAESDTLASVTGRGNSTTNAITVGGLTVATNLIYTDTVNNRVGIGTTSPTRTLTVNGSISIPNNSAYITKTNGGSELAVFLTDASNNVQIGSIFFGANQINYTATNFDWYQYPSSVLTQRMRLWGITGNLTLQNGGTFTDAGFRLDVNGTARIQNQLTTTGSITAASAIARGVYMNQTLVAAANGDVLVGLDINPTFTVGSFKGVTSAALRIGGNIIPSANNLYSFGTGNVGFKDIFAVGNVTAGRLYTGTFAFNATDINYRNLADVIIARWFGTGNLTLQNGGTFTDAGYRLDVVGADSRFNGIRAGLGAGQVATNTVFGNGAFATNSTGTQSVAVGYNALRDSTANSNTAVGSQSLLANTTGANNTAIGVNSLFTNTTGGSNTAVGLNTQSGNFSGSLILGRDAVATASNQFVVGSTSYNAGSVTTATAVQTKTWDVIINGVAQKILLA